MSVWGRGLLQSADDYAIAQELSEMCGCQLLNPREDEIADTAQKLTEDVLSLGFGRILSANFQLRTGHHKRERVAIILGMLAMERGAILERPHLVALGILRPWLPTIEQQLQLITALDQYKNDGTPWVSGSKGLVDAEASRQAGPQDYDLGDEFWFSGLGHSYDESPTSEMVSSVCLDCGEKPADLLRCSRCNMARYCNATCQRNDWAIHKKVCYVRDSVRVCPVPPSA